MNRECSGEHREQEYTESRIVEKGEVYMEHMAEEVRQCLIQGSLGGNLDDVLERSKGR